MLMRPYSSFSRFRLLPLSRARGGLRLPSRGQDCRFLPLRYGSAFAGLIFVLASAVLSAATAQEWVALPQRIEAVMIEGQQVTIPFRPEIRFPRGAGNGFVLYLRARAHLGELQRKTPAILAALAARESNCETRWSFPQLPPPAVAEGRLRIAGQVRLEQWLCGVLKTRLARETADFVIAVFPILRAGELAVAAKLEHFDLGRSLLGDVGLADIIRHALSEQLSRVLDTVRLGFPPEIVALQPQFTGAELRKAGDETAEIVVQAQVSVAAGEVSMIMGLITRYLNRALGGE